MTLSREIQSGVDGIWYNVRWEHSSFDKPSHKQHTGGWDQGGDPRASYHPASSQTFFHTEGR